MVSFSISSFPLSVAIAGNGRWGRISRWCVARSPTTRTSTRSSSCKTALAWCLLCNFLSWWYVDQLSIILFRLLANQSRGLFWRLYVLNFYWRYSSNRRYWVAPFVSPQCARLKVTQLYESSDDEHVRLCCLLTLLYVRPLVSCTIQLLSQYALSRCFKM